MKVKNIMFSGFAAALFAGVCGAASAADYTLASKGFVETQLAKKQNTLTAGSGIDITDDTISADLSTVTVKDAEGNDVNVSSALTNLSTSVAGVESKLEGLPEGKTVAEVLGDKQDTLSNAEVLGTITQTMVDSIGSTAEAVADLETYVGTIPEGATATDVVAYVQEKTSGIASEGAMTELSNRVGLVEVDIEALESAVTGEGEGSVAKKISTALTGYATEEYVATELGDYALKTELPTVPTNVSAFNNDAGYLTEETADELYDAAGAAAAVDAKLSGYATTDAMNSALQGKQNVISNLATIEENAAKGATAVQPETLTQTLGSYVTSETLAGYDYQNESQVKNTIEGYGYQTEAQVEAEIAGATIEQSQVNGLATALAAKANASEVTTALDGKLDDTMTAAGTYLVKRAENGDISYVSVEIVGATEE